MRKEKNNFHKYIIGFWIAFALPIVVLTVVFTLISYGKLGYMPTFEDLENPNSNIASEVISDDHKVLGQYFYQNRTFVDYSELSPYVIQALIATEDVRFYRHSGIDFRSLLRVMVRTVLLRDHSAGGGSTLTQQLAKQLFHESAGNIFERVWQKLNEWVIAIKLEKSYTKEEIISLYLNQVDFLNLAVGIKSAAKVYFNSTPDSLKLEQAAMLIGMVKNPAIFNPLRRPEKTLLRRNVVLAQMKKYGYLDENVYDSVATLPLTIDYQKVDHHMGLAPYFREYLRLIMNADKPHRRKYNSYASFKDDSLDWVNNPLFGWCNKTLSQTAHPTIYIKTG
ncbi:MAG: transglycosylase domain-containing protein [Bacteroidales bacterium]|nr:transglycosylase domain-containing protein [Bacteroidales bacterium]